LTFKKNGSLLLDFSFTQKNIDSSISYTIIKNQQKIDKFSLSKLEKYQTSLNVITDDCVEIQVTIDGMNSYWGAVEVSINTFSFSFHDLLIILLWIVLFLFLYYRNYGYLAVLAYMIFYIMLFSENLNFKTVTFDLAFTYTFFLFSWTFIFLWIYQIFSKIKKYKISFILISLISTLLTFIPLLFILYALNFDHALSKEALYAVFQSNSNESLEYIEKFISIHYIFLFLSISLFMVLLIYKQEAKETLKIENSLLWFIIIIFALITSSEFSNFKLGHFVVKNFNKYTKELKLFKEVQEKRKTGEIKFTATKEAEGETHIVVIGESLNKNHMGIYGYMRNTTPYLSKLHQENELMVFNNSYSNHTHTVPVLSLSLTEANQYNNKNYYDSLSIIEVLNKANTETYWLTNQNIYGEWDNMISVLATTSKKLVALNHTIGCNVTTQQHDENIINPLKSILSKKTNKNKVIFIHLIGSHSVYASRYPKDKFSIYTKKLNERTFGKSALINQEINYYDNSIVYNDYVVSSLLKLFKNSEGVKSFIYMSDHADDINKDLGHSKDVFTYEMTEIPLIAWFSSEYKKKYFQTYNTLLENKDKLFSNDMLYDTLIGILNIKTDKYNSTYDISSNSYTLNVKDALVLHGQRKYIEKENHRYWQKKNIDNLLTSNLISKVTPSNISTLGTAHELINSKFNSIALSLSIKDYIYLEEYFELQNFNLVEKIFLRFNDLNKKNYRQILDKLNNLNKKYQLKNKLVIELSLDSEEFNEFTRSSWICSYIINNTSTSTILEQIKLNQTKYISFHINSYPYIKKHLESKISKNIFYNIQSTLSLSDIQFIKKLPQNLLDKDKKIKKLFISYESDFNR